MERKCCSCSVKYYISFCILRHFSVILRFESFDYLCGIVNLFLNVYFTIIANYFFFQYLNNTSRSFPSRSWLITGFVTRLTRRVSLVEQELLTLPERLSSPPVFSVIRVTRSLVLYVCFVDRCLSFCTFSFGHCVVCSSSIYVF